MDADEKRRKHNEYMREWRKRHPDEQKAYHARRFEDPDYRERARRRAAEWYAANRERARETNRQRHERNPRRPPPKPQKDASYYRLHKWISEQKGRPARCEHCGTESAKRYEWANVDHQYRADLADWLRLCKSCHCRYDLANGLAKKGGRPRARREDA